MKPSQRTKPTYYSDKVSRKLIRYVELFTHIRTSPIQSDEHIRSIPRATLNAPFIQVIRTHIVRHRFACVIGVQRRHGLFDWNPFACAEFSGSLSACLGTLTEAGEYYFTADMSLSYTLATPAASPFLDRPIILRSVVSSSFLFDYIPKVSLDTFDDHLFLIFIICKLALAVPRRTQPLEGPC